MVRTSFQRLLFVLAVALCFAITLAGQLNRGVIEGVVTDSQDAIVPDVDVRVVSLDTAVSLPAKTNNAGYYRVVDLVPGKYRVLFDAKGFSELALTDIQVPAGSVIRADAQLRVGTASQSVQVTAEVPLVETGASDFSTTIDTRTIQDLPLQGRDLQQLIFLVPGVVGNGPPGSSFGFNSQFGAFPDPTHLQGTNVSVNGGQGGTNAWYLDGNLNLSGSAESIVVNPSPDAVTEFQTITNAFSAEYGRSGGAVFNVVLKSGTNRAHGNLYEYVRNSHFNARNPFTSIDSVGKVVPQDQLHFNNFGGTFGGPVVLPRLYNGKNKTFFFFSWDTSILHLGGSRTYTVPTPLMRQGNFSEDPNASYGIWNPYSTVGPDAQGQFQRSAFGTPVPGNPYGADGCLNSAVGAGAAAGVRTCNFATQLPASMLNPTAMFFMNKFPMPNYRDPLSGCPLAAGGAYGICNNFLGAIGSSQDSQNISLKIDHAWSDKSRYFAEWLFNPGKYNNFRLPWTGPTFPASGLGFGSTLPFDFRNQIIALGNTYTFRPTFINEFRASFSRQFYTTHPETTGYPDSVTELSSVEKLLAPIKIPLFPPSPAPSWSVSSPGGGSNMDFGPVGWTSNMTATEAYTVLDNVTKILGKHTIKTGFTYRLQHSGQFQSAPTNLGFYGGGVVDPQTGLGAGSGLAQFMLGAVQNDGSSYATGAWQPYMRHRYWGFFAQDDFRVTSKLTLNFGLRYDIFGAYKTRQHPNARFCLSCPNPDTGVPGIVQYEGDPGFPMNSDIVPPNFNDWGPRVNFSWAPFNNRKTVIRGGYDVFYSNAYAAQNSAQAVENGVGYAYDNIWQGSINPSQCAPLTGQCVAWSLGDTSSVKGDLTIPVVTGTFPAQQKEPLYATYMNSVFKPAHDPMVQSWTLEVQRELPGNFAVTIGYVGTHGTHLVGDMWHNYNYVSTANRLQYRKGLSAVAPISDYYSGKTASKLEEVWGSSSLPRSLLLLPNPFWPAISTTETFDGSSSYHGLHVRVQKRYSHGLNFSAAYTYSKSIVSANTGQLVATVIDPIHFGRNGYVGGLTGALFSQNIGTAYQDPDNIRADRALAPNDMPHQLHISASYELPFGTGRALLRQKGPLNVLFGGWALTGLMSMQSGVPLSISGPCNAITCRPNLVGDPSLSGGRSRQEQIADWINPAAFEPVFGGDQTFWANPDQTDSRWWRFGNAGLRLPGLRSPGFYNIDTSLSKQFHVTETAYFDFRWEAFNTLNHQNLGLPNTNFCLPPTASGGTDLVHQAGCQFGRITNIQTDPRAMEFALKFYW